jgi:GT2 family glycosyltransferase
MIEIDGNQTPQISVVLPFHIRNSFLMDAIASVQSHSGPDVEIVCVADGLPSSEIKSLRLFFLPDSRVQILQNDGQGLVDALNTGIKASRAPLIARMDSDDLFMPNRLEIQKKYLDSHPRISAVGGQLIYICKHSVTLGRSRYPSRYQIVFGLKPILPHIAHPAAMFRKSLWESIGGYRADFPHVEDLDFWNRALKIGPIHNLNKDLIKYRLHPGQISTTQAKVQRFQAMRADLYDLLGHVPALVDQGESLLCSHKEILRSNQHLVANQRRALRHVLGFFVTRESLAEIGLNGGLFRGSNQSKRQLFDAILTFPIQAAFLAASTVRDYFGQARVNWSVCPTCSSER